MNRFVFDLELTVVTPFIFPSVAAGRYGLDKIMMTDPSGRLVIPMDQLRGLLRHQVSKLVELDETGTFSDLLKDLFGKESDNILQDGTADGTGSGSFEPERGTLFVEDLRADNAARSGSENRPYIDPFPRVAIEETSGAAREGALILTEQPDRPEQDFTFKGTLSFFSAPDHVDAKTNLLEVAFKSLVEIGALTSIGFGRVKRDKSKFVESKLKPATANSVNIAQSNHFELQFTLDRPYLVDSMLLAGNAYLGKPEIPGSALKGLLARNFSLNGKDIHSEPLKTALSNMRLGFASLSPLEQTVRPTSCAVSGGKLVNLLGVPAEHHGDAVFQIDWKSEDKAIAQKSRPLQLPDLTYDERVHTRIDPKTGAAENEMLFSTIAVDAGSQIFRCAVDLGRVDTSVAGELKKALCEPLYGLGKTGAELLPVSQNDLPSVAFENFGDDLVALHLLTPGCLASWEDGDTMSEAYLNFWKEHAPDCELIDHYATQSLSGGYLGRRFRGSKSRYRTFLLTNPGSVFLFRTTTQTAKDQLSGVLSNGLCRAKIDDEPTDWQSCPFVAENGYGTFQCLSN